MVPWIKQDQIESDAWSSIDQASLGAFDGNVFDGDAFDVFFEFVSEDLTSSNWVSEAPVT